MRSRRRSSPGQIRAPGAVPQRRPARLLGAQADDRAGNLDQLAAADRAAGLGAELHRAARLEDVHRLERRRHRRADGEQAVVAQDEEGVGAEIGDQARLLLVVQGHAFVVVVAEAGEDEDRELRDRQQAALLRRDRDAVQRVGVHHALHVVARRVHRAVDDEAGRVDRERRLLQHLALDVDLDQARRRDLVEHQAVGIDQVVLGAGDPGGDVGEDEIVPAEQGDQAVGGGEVEAGLPFVVRDPAFEAGDHAREFGGCVHRGLLERRDSKYDPGEAVLRALVPSAATGLDSTDDRSERPAARRHPGDRVHPHGDGSHLRDHPRRPRRRGDQGRAARRRQHPKARRRGRRLLRPVQPQQEEHRGRHQGSARPRDRAQAGRRRRRLQRELQGGRDGAARLRLRRALAAQSAPGLRLAQGLSAGPLRPPHRPRRGGADDGRPGLHDRPDRPAAARRQQRQRHHGRDVRRDRRARRPRRPAQDRQGPGGAERPVREQRLPGRPAHDAGGGDGRAAGADAEPDLALGGVRRLHRRRRASRSSSRW